MCGFCAQQIQLETVRSVQYVFGERDFVGRAGEFVGGAVANHEAIQLGAVELGDPFYKHFTEPVVDEAFLFLLFEPGFESLESFVAAEAEEVDDLVDIGACGSVGRYAGFEPGFLVIEIIAIDAPVLDRVFLVGAGDHHHLFQGVVLAFYGYLKGNVELVDIGNIFYRELHRGFVVVYETQGVFPGNGDVVATHGIGNGLCAGGTLYFYILHVIPFGNIEHNAADGHLCPGSAGGAGKQEQ